MPDNFRHLRIDNFAERRIYRYPRTVVGEFEVRERNRAIHGNAIREQLNNIREHYRISQQEELPQNIIRDDVVYVEFLSAINFSLKFESINQEKTDPKFQILTIKEENLLIDNAEAKRFRVVVMMKAGGISEFIKKVNRYINENVKDRNGNITDKPKNEALINNIESIQIATLQSFWSDAPEIPFPNIDDVLWWEVWFRRTTNDSERIERVVQNLSGIGAQIGAETLQFPEHLVRLVRSSARQLSSSLLLLDNLAELRKPQEINDFITAQNVTYSEQQEWLDELQRRTEIQLNES
ncbi:MAG: hypothetical protein ABUT20_36090, partial [Bacteroidota bacterium]